MTFTDFQPRAGCLTAAILLTSMTACGPLPGFEVLNKDDNFDQIVSINDKVDILFVIDNSGSMGEEQLTLTESFTSFIDQFRSRNLNFQIGVISTDVQTDPDWWTGTGAWLRVSGWGFFGQSGSGTLVGLGANPRLLTPNTPNLVQTFQENARLYTYGWFEEAGILAAYKALSPERLAVGAANEGLVRDDALLAVVVLSDEDESVGDMSSQLQDYIRNYPALRAQRVSDFAERFRSLKPDRPDLLRFDAIIAPSAAECPTGLPGGEGEVYAEVAGMFRGTVSNICQDFSAHLVKIGSDLVNLLTSFKIKQKPAGPITVIVDDVVVPENAENGWQFDEPTLVISFHGTSVPKADAKIKVNYVPSAPLK